MKCPYCNTEMKRNERIKITHFAIKEHPEEYKSGWSCPECESIIFDKGINCANYSEKKPKIKIIKKKCILCKKNIDWKHHGFPLAYLLYDPSLIERFCPTCWDRIWAEWYEYPENSEHYNLTYEYPSDEYIISKYKGNDLVSKIKKARIFSEGAWSTNILGDKKPKKKHRCNK